MDELHPNWRALATIHLPLKRFIRAGTSDKERGHVEDQQSYAVEAGSGAEIKKFYDTILQENPRATRHKVECMSTAVARGNSSDKPKQLYDVKLCYRYAMQNNVAALGNMQFNGDDINTCDAYGWSALMMAACEGATEAVQFFIKNGANTKMKDKSGLTAADLARRKGHYSIVNLLEAESKARVKASVVDVTHEPQIQRQKKPFYCDVCRATFKETSEKEHQTSTLHQFNAKPIASSHALSKFNISQRNRGLQLMVKQGWNKESGLGPAQAGRLYPVKTVIRKQRSGLGVEQAPARVTHFDAFDVRATERHNDYYKNAKKRSRNDIKSEKIREWKRDRRLRNELS